MHKGDHWMVRMPPAPDVWPTMAMAAFRANATVIYEVQLEDFGPRCAGRPCSDGPSERRSRDQRETATMPRPTSGRRRMRSAQRATFGNCRELSARCATSGYIAMSAIAVDAKDEIAIRGALPVRRGGAVFSTASGAASSACGRKRPVLRASAISTLLAPSSRALPTTVSGTGEARAAIA